MMQRDGQRLVLDGPVTLATHVVLRDAVTAQLADTDLCIDWHAVAAVDSSAVCLILHWRREAATRGRQVRQENLPAGLTALAALYGVGELLA
jgi:phospholipid transport system transporter-binding protein